MNGKENNINDEVLNVKKKLLCNKEKQIIKSQTIQNKLEDKIKKLKLKKEKIIKGNKWTLGNIVFTMVYDAIMATILILFVIWFTNKINLITALFRTIYIIGVSLGILTISVIGAYIAANICEKIKKYCNQKRILNISKLIKEKEILLSREISRQENLKKEITNIMNDLDDNMEINDVENEHNLISHITHDIPNIDNEPETKEIVNIKKKIKR